MSEAKKILVVEDDPAMATGLRDGLGYEGYDLSVAADGVAALRLAAELAPDLIILDVMLPRLTGLDVCKQLRRDRNPVPIIMLTARGQEIDKVLGLKLGADDYITKPFSFMELSARVEALLRRASGQVAGPVDEVCSFGDVHVDFGRHEALKGERPLSLSPREFRLLEYLISHRGELVTREQLLDRVWGYRHVPLTRTVDTHIAKLRKKIEDRPSEPRHIVTVHRLGYRFAS